LIDEICVRKCGNGVLNPDENCDDGNEIEGDGCSFNCTIEDGYICNQEEPSVCSLRPPPIV